MHDIQTESINITPCASTSSVEDIVLTTGNIVNSDINHVEEIPSIVAPDIDVSSVTNNVIHIDDEPCCSSTAQVDITGRHDSVNRWPDSTSITMETIK